MYTNGPRSLGRGHQSGPRSQFVISYDSNELEKVTGKSNGNRLGREKKKWAEVTRPRSPKWAEVTGPRSPWAEVTCILTSNDCRSNDRRSNDCRNNDRRSNDSRKNYCPKCLGVVCKSHLHGYTGIYPNQSNKHVCQIFLNGFYCIFPRRFQIYQIPFEILHI